MRSFLPKTCLSDFYINLLFSKSFYPSICYARPLRFRRKSSESLSPRARLTDRRMFFLGGMQEAGYAKFWAGHLYDTPHYSVCQPPVVAPAEPFLGRQIFISVSCGSRTLKTSPPAARPAQTQPRHLQELRGTTGCHGEKCVKKNERERGKEKRNKKQLRRTSSSLSSSAVGPTRSLPAIRPREVASPVRNVLEWLEPPTNWPFTAPAPP